MINYDIDQRQKDLQAQGNQESHIAGCSDGSLGLPLRIKFMHDTAYIKGYVIGISQWAAELERREQENYADSALEF